MTTSTAPHLIGLVSLHPTAQAQLFTEARTAQTFTDEPVTDEQLRAIHELVKWPPTAFNLQPLRVLYVRPGESRERLVAHLSPGNQAKTRTAPAVAVLAADVDFHEHAPRLVPFAPNLRQQLHDNPNREAVARLNAALQAGYYLLGVRAAGLAAGPMTGFDAEGVDREFFGDRNLRSLLVVNIGRPGPDAWKDRLPRLDHDDVVTFV